MNDILNFESRGVSMSAWQPPKIADKQYTADQDVIYNTRKHADVVSSGVKDTHLSVRVHNGDEVLVEMYGLYYPVDTTISIEEWGQYRYNHKLNSPQLASMTQMKVGNLNPKEMTKRPCRQKRLQPGCRLWEFIRNLLHNPLYNPTLLTWSDKQKGEFRLIKTKEIAQMWGREKNNNKMTYEKLSRALRYYYKTQILLPVLGKRLMYKFGPTAYGWK